jgi:hypothetical protein
MHPMDTINDILLFFSICSYRPSYSASIQICHPLTPLTYQAHMSLASICASRNVSLGLMIGFGVVEFDGNSSFICGKMRCSLLVTTKRSRL